MSSTGNPHEWWIATDRLAQGGEKILGPFAAKELALDVRRYVEAAHAPRTYWVDQDEAPAGTEAEDAAAWHDGWTFASRDGDGNLILRYEPSGGLYRVLPIEETRAVADDLTAELDRIKADTLSLAQTRTPSWGTVPKIQRVIDRTEHLLAAVEAVLNLHQPGRVAILGSLCEHHESCRHFSISRTEADGVRACPDCTATVYNSCTGCGPGVSVDACVTRLAITREITLTSSPPQDGDSN